MKRRKPSTYRVLKVGITGGIGSGKTAACKMFEEFGVPIYYADERAKHLMQHEHHLIDEIKKIFGHDAYIQGKLNRKFISDQAFQEPSKLASLNALVHPAVFHDTEVWMEDQVLKKVTYTLHEAALLIETGSYKGLDKLIVVTAPLDVRIARIKARDVVELEEVMARVRNQLPEEEKVKLADFVIKNDGDFENLQKQVRDIHESLLIIAGSSQ